MKDIPFNVMLALGSLVYAFGLWTDNIVGRQWSSVIKQVKTWLIGVLAVVIAAHVQWTSDWTVAGLPLHSLDLTSQLLLGLTGAAFSNTVFHLGQRIDKTGSGDTPDMPVSTPPKVVRNQPTTEARPRVRTRKAG